MIEVTKLDCDEPEVTDVTQYDQEDINALSELVASLTSEVNALKYSLKEMRKLVSCDSNNEKCEGSVKEIPKQFVSILSLISNKIISAKVGTALDVAGIKYVQDFQYLTLPELTSIPVLSGNNLSWLLNIVEEYSGAAVDNSKKECPDYCLNDLVKYIGADDGPLKADDVLRICNIDKSGLIPKYTCVKLGSDTDHWLLSPSIIRKIGIK